ncbi:MAG: hypothetical protein M3436_01525 [Pseudomonadota bacterium]|nr:hypothetical protein [Pseudomonadota bacterium]
MANYRVIAASVNIHAGVLGLEPHQARARLHRLKPCGGNRYEVIDPPVAFKRGEIFEYEGELPKSLVESVAEEGNHEGCPYTLTAGDRPDDPFPVIDAELATEPGPDDGVAAPPPKRKKVPRGAKQAA